jgi:putative oxidoreductase
MTTDTSSAGWPKAAVLVGRLIFAAIFIVAASFKFYDIDGTVKYITAGLPASKILTWLAAALGGAPDGVRMLR